MGEPDRKILLGRPRHGWEDNSKMDLREPCIDASDWIELAQGRD